MAAGYKLGSHFDEQKLQRSIYRLPFCHIYSPIFGGSGPFDGIPQTAKTLLRYGGEESPLFVIYSY